MTRPRGEYPTNGVLLDSMPGDDLPRRVPPMLEVGKSGLRRTGGYVEEEFLPQLRGRKSVQVFREMGDNDPIVGAMLFAVDNLLRQIQYRVEAATNKAADRKNADFVEQCMNDMSHSWSDLISEAVSMNRYGWAFHEIVYKKRVGPWERNPRYRSKYSDGLIGWRKIPIRSQETLLRWVFDADGGIQAMVQMAPPDYRTVVLPIDKALLFRTTSAKNNPEGWSLLRTAYRPWFLKKRMEEFESIGVERDLAGLPVGKVPAEYLNAKPGTDQAKMVDAFKKMVKAVRRDEQEGLVLPLAYDPDTKQPLFDFSLLTSGGTRQFDTSAIIQRYEQRILMSILADFILLGHEGTGSYAMHTDKTGLFRTAINSLAKSIADVFNRHAIPKLFAINGMKPDELPTIVPNDVDPPDLTQLAGFMTSMAGAGMTWFPDPELEKFLRDAARLPKLDETVEHIHEVEQREQAIIGLAQQRMQALQLEQQAAQGQLQLDGQTMGNQAQAAQLEAGPQGPDPAEAQRGSIAVDTDKVKLAQEKQKLANLKKPPAKKAPASKAPASKATPRSRR